MPVVNPAAKSFHCKQWGSLLEKKFILLAWLCPAFQIKVNQRCPKAVPVFQGSGKGGVVFF
jgi:hypothetical protein